MMLLKGDPIESLQLLREALNERNYFLKVCPYLNKELELAILSDSLLKELFYYFPGVLLYHWIYLW